MPLSAVNFVPLTGQIKAADLRQFFDLFTGVMTDQPVTFANTLQVGGSQGAGAAPVRIGGVAAQTANMVEIRKLAADVQPEFSVGPTGTLAWGPGGGVGTDVSLARSLANQLTLQGLAGTPALVIPVGGVTVQAGTVDFTGATVKANLPTVQLTTTSTALSNANLWTTLSGGTISIPAGTYLVTIDAQINTGVNADSPVLSLNDTTAGTGGAPAYFTGYQINEPANSQMVLSRTGIVTFASPVVAKLQVFSSTSISVASLGHAVLTRIA